MLQIKYNQGFTIAQYCAISFSRNIRDDVHMLISPLYIFKLMGIEYKWIRKLNKPMKNIPVVLKQKMCQKFPVTAQTIPSFYSSIICKKDLYNGRKSCIFAAMFSA